MVGWIPDMHFVAERAYPLLGGGPSRMHRERGETAVGAARSLGAKPRRRDCHDYREKNREKTDVAGGEHSGWATGKKGHVGTFARKVRSGVAVASN
jgi:hypothetical protein